MKIVQLNWVFWWNQTVQRKNCNNLRRVDYHSEKMVSFCTTIWAPLDNFFTFLINNCKVSLLVFFVMIYGDKASVAQLLHDFNSCLIIYYSLLFVDHHTIKSKLLPTLPQWLKQRSVTGKNRKENQKDRWDSIQNHWKNGQEKAWML